jgi:hypothetical protein
MALWKAKRYTSIILTQRVSFIDAVVNNIWGRHNLILLAVDVSVMVSVVCGKLWPMKILLQHQSDTTKDPLPRKIFLIGFWKGWGQKMAGNFFGFFYLYGITIRIILVSRNIIQVIYMTRQRAWQTWSKEPVIWFISLIQRKAEPLTSLSHPNNLACAVES